MEKDLKFKGLTWLATFLFAAPSAVYLICICSFAGKSAVSANITGSLAQWFFVVINGIRLLSSIIGIAYATSKHDPASVDPLVRRDSFYNLCNTFLNRLYTGV
jgi:hypothetical protein